MDPLNQQSGQTPTGQQTPPVESPQPINTSPVSPQPMAPVSADSTVHHHIKGLAVLIALVVIVVLASSVFGYFKFFSSEAPIKTDVFFTTLVGNITKSQEMMKSGEIGIKIDVTAKDITPNLAGKKLRLSAIDTSTNTKSGSVAPMFPKDFKASALGTMLINGRGNNLDMSMDGSASADFGGIKVDLGGALAKIRNDFYFKVSNFPMLATVIPDIKANQWYRLSDEITKNPEFIAMMDQFNQAYAENQTKSIEMNLKIAQKIDSEKVMAINAPEKVEENGVTLYRYDMKFNKDAFIPFFKEVIKIIAEENPDLNQNPNLENIDEAFKDRNFMDAIDMLAENVKTSLYIDSKGYLAKVDFNLVIIPDEASAPVTNNQYVDMNIIYTLNRMGEDIKIDAPANAIEFNLPKPKVIQTSTKK